MALAQALPQARFTERHSREIDAPPERVWTALEEVSWRDLRLTKPLTLLRGFDKSRRVSNQRLLDQGPVSLLYSDAPRYAAGASIGRPWQLRPERGPAVTDLQGLSDFTAHGWLKYGWDFTLQALPSGRTRIVTTTRCEPTDESTRRRFRPYWALIRPFSGLIRRDILHAIARLSTSSVDDELPPGQRELVGPPPRFGLPQYLRVRFDIPAEPELQILGPGKREITLGRERLDSLPETTKTLDLHCVTTWSALGIRWTGWRFTDVWERFLHDLADPATTELVFTGLDGAEASIPLAELLHEGILIAHSRDGRPLARRDGGPYRLVIPHLYGYKNLKYLYRIELVEKHRKSPHEPWIMHPIGRVAREERHGLGMNRAVRLANRLLVRRFLRSTGLRDPRFR